MIINYFNLQMSVARQSKVLDSASLGLLSVALKTAGLVGLGLALGLAIVELIGYFIRFLSGTQSRSFAPISSSVLGSASSAWMNRYHNGLHDMIHPYMGDGRGRLVFCTTPNSQVHHFPYAFYHSIIWFQQ